MQEHFANSWSGFPSPRLVDLSDPALETDLSGVGVAYEAERDERGNDRRPMRRA